jgi:hypothetical protein
MRRCSARPSAIAFASPDTDLWIEVEKDHTVYGEEVKFGGGKVIRDGMGQSQRIAKDVADTVITNALIVDHWGIVKADIGSKGGASGRSARPATRHPAGGHDPIGAGTEVIAGEGHDRHRRRHRHAHPLHLPAADRRGADVGRHHDARRRHRAGDGTSPPPARRARGTSRACCRRRKRFR